jgi:hypothetical protein
MRVKIALQFFNLTSNALDFHCRLAGWSGEPAQFCHVALESVDFQLAFAGHCIPVCDRGGV